MKELPLILTLHASVLSAFIWLASPACADSGTDYKAGSDFAKQVQGSGIDSLKNFSGEQNLPGYTDSPDQTKYYGGVTAGGDSALKGDSAAEFSQGETGKTITESFTNRPPDLVSPEDHDKVVRRLRLTHPDAFEEDDDSYARRMKEERRARARDAQTPPTPRKTA